MEPALAMFSARSSSTENTRSDEGYSALPVHLPAYENAPGEEGVMEGDTETETEAER
jgi:hypothetical protein